MPDLWAPGFDRYARMDLAGHGEDPSLVGMLLVPALARNRDSLDIRQLAVGAHYQLAAAILSRIGLLAKGLARGSISRIGAQRELDQPEPRPRTILQLRNLDVLQTQVFDLEQIASNRGPALGLQLFPLRLLVLAGVQARDVGRSGDAALDVGGVPEVADPHQPGEAIRHLAFRQAVRMRVEPV